MSEYNKLAKKKNNINTTEIIDFFQLKKLIITQTLMKLKKNITDHDHDKYITTQKFNN